MLNVNNLVNKTNAVIVVFNMQDVNIWLNQVNVEIFDHGKVLLDFAVFSLKENFSFNLQSFNNWFESEIVFK